MKYDALIVGAGLAGLSCGYELAAKGKKVLILEEKSYPGGRTSSFKEQGMAVESGFHRYIGYYSALPKLLKHCGININDIVIWEETADILVKNKKGQITLGLAPFWGFQKTLQGIIGNKEFLSGKDKRSLLPFFSRGFLSYIRSEDLDTFSVEEYANLCGVTERAKKLLLEPLSTGIFFLPMEQYSAYAFFGLFAPAIPKFYKMRIGAFRGGMTDIMCSPIVKEIEKLGGEFRFDTSAASILQEGEKVTGVRLDSEENFHAKDTVIATTLSSAKKILSPLKGQEELKKLFALPTMSACTLQAELYSPARGKDITTFGPTTDLVSFAEQSRSTFPQCEGRLSIILGHPEKYMELQEEDILPTVLEELQALGIDLSENIKKTRKIAEPQGFYSLAKENQHLRPDQHTGISGLTLAGDYTFTSSFATMEGAVISGKKAAKVILHR